jgi:predicted transcriptional regulator
VSTLDNYIQYFHKHPSSLDLCYFLTLNSNKWITASLLSKELNLSVQTVTNSLKGLETKRILYSSKEGRERRYFPLDPAKFSKAFDESLQSLQNKRMKGRRFPLQLLLDKLGRELRRLSAKDDQNLEVLQNARLSNQLIDLVCQFQIVRQSIPINTVLISQIESEDSILSLLGTILMIAEELIEGSLTIVLLIDPSRVSYESYSVLLSKRVQFIFRTLAKNSSSSQNKEKNGTLNKKVSIVEKFADESTLLIPGYAKKLASEIWEFTTRPGLNEKNQHRVF